MAHDWPSLISAILSAAFGGGVLGFILAEMKFVRKIDRQEKIWMARFDEYKEELMTKRERELYDARRTTMPRDDAGAPAVIRDIGPLRRVRKTGE